MSNFYKIGLSLKRYKRSREETRYFPTPSSHHLFWAVSVLWALELFTFWPGVLRVDSLDQLNQALAHSFSDHHPPLMALYWSLLNKIYPGPGLMLGTHLLLFWGSIYHFARSLDHKGLQLSYFIIGMSPPLLMFHPFILKDIGFAHSYFFVISCLAYYTLKQKSPSLVSLIGLLLILFYGTAVKFQAVFILPLLTFWLGYSLQQNYKKAALVGISLFVVFYGAISLFNARVATSSHSWQYVKLYDLAGISLCAGQNYFPTFVIDHPGFSSQRLKELYNISRVDDLAFIPNPVLIKGKDEQQSQELWQYWFKTILNHPLAYLKHRFSIFWCQINRSFIKAPSEIQSHQEDNSS